MCCDCGVGTAHYRKLKKTEASRPHTLHYCSGIGIRFPDPYQKDELSAVSSISQAAIPIVTPNSHDREKVSLVTRSLVFHVQTLASCNNPDSVNNPRNIA